MRFRFARHTQDIKKLSDFYTSILNFEILGEFKNHEGYDGVMIGLKKENWHLEFTQNAEKPQSKCDEDDALVFYPDTRKSYDEILKNLKKSKVPLLEPKNPYWKDKGVCFEDCERLKIIISSEKTGE